MQVCDTEVLRIGDISKKKNNFVWQETFACSEITMMLLKIFPGCYVTTNQNYQV